LIEKQQQALVVVSVVIAVVSVVSDSSWTWVALQKA